MSHNQLETDSLRAHALNGSLGVLSRGARLCIFPVFQDPIQELQGSSRQQGLTCRSQDGASRAQWRAPLRPLHNKLPSTAEASLIRGDTSAQQPATCLPACELQRFELHG